MRTLLNWLEERTGLVSATVTAMLHPVPRGAKWWYVFGSATLFVFIIQVITGIVLATMYVPSPDLAYQSLLFITKDAFLGGFIRGLHSWAATAMVILVGVHLIQVFLFAAYKYPREVNWLSGVLLLAVTLGMAFTGQILRWDDNGVWTTVVLVNMAGDVPVVGNVIGRFLLSGSVVNASTLSHFFTYHVFLIPAIVFVGIGIHLYLVLRNGISEPPVKGLSIDPKTYHKWYHDYLKTDGVPFWPDALWRDVVACLVVVAILAALAAFVGAPELTKPPSPADVNTNPRPEWYFVWLFAALALLPPSIEFYILMGGSLIFFVALVLLPILASRGDRTPQARPWSVGIVVVAVALVGALTVQGLQAPWSPNFQAQQLSPQVVGTTTGAVAQGGKLFYDKGCIYCHAIAGNGGNRGPDLTHVGDRLDANQLIWRISNGGVNMPAYAGTFSKDDMNNLVAFLLSRKTAPPEIQAVQTQKNTP